MLSALVFLAFVVVAGAVALLLLAPFAQFVISGAKRLDSLKHIPAGDQVNVALDVTPLVGRSEHLRFRNAEPADDDRLLEIAMDPIVVAGNGWSEDVAQRWSASFADEELMSRRRNEWIVAEEISTGSIVGYAVLGPAPFGKAGFSVGFLLGEEARFHRYGLELGAASIEILRGTFLVDFWAGVLPGNEALRTMLDGLELELLPGVHDFGPGVDEQVMLYRSTRNANPWYDTIWQGAS